MEYQDLRDWIQIADEMGELKTLKGCDWNLEIGALTEMFAFKEPSPMVLFDQIPGYPANFRVVSNIVSNPTRSGLTVGMAADGAITFWNPRAEAIFGCSAAEALGRDLAELILPPTDREAHRRGLERFLTVCGGDDVESAGAEARRQQLTNVCIVVCDQYERSVASSRVCQRGHLM